MIILLAQKSSPWRWFSMSGRFRVKDSVVSSSRNGNRSLLIPSPPATVPRRPPQQKWDISARISRLSAAILSSRVCVSPYSATIHSLSPFHFHGCKVPCKAWDVQISRDPLMVSINPMFRGGPPPPFAGFPSAADFQKASVAPFFFAFHPDFPAQK